MSKKVIAALATLIAASALAAVEANTATQADLETVDGVGPTLSTSIIDERRKGEFKDWSDLLSRVRGVGERSAARLSARGMTVMAKRMFMRRVSSPRRRRRRPRRHHRPAPAQRGS